jgi:N-acetylmuramic acid 6-phosphate etherase
MKAGTAQKIALNLLSTAIMVRLGHVHAGLMVDMRVSNRKLRRRAIAMVAQLSGADPAQAEAALDLAHNEIKLATLVAVGMDVDQARALLSESRNNLRTALERSRDQGSSA